MQLGKSVNKVVDTQGSSLLKDQFRDILSMSDSTPSNWDVIRPVMY